MVKAGEGGGEEGLEAAALGRGEIVGKREGGEIVEGAADALEAALELGGAGGDGGGARLGAKAAQRVAQQQAAVGFVGAAKDLDEQQGLARGQAVALGAVEELVLVLGAQLAQGTREGGADDAPAELVLGGRRQAGADGPASFDPVGLVAQKASDGRRGEPVFVDERANHPALVESGHGARGSVGLQKQPLVLGGRSRVLDDDGHGALAQLAPAVQALESVDDLEGAVIGGGDPERHLGQRLGMRWASTRSQISQAGTKPFDGQPANRSGERLGRIGCRLAGGAGVGPWLGHAAPQTASAERSPCVRVLKRPAARRAWAPQGSTGDGRRRAGAAHRATPRDRP